MQPRTQIDLTNLDNLLNQYPDGGRTHLLPVLHQAQKLYRYLPESVLIRISEALRVPLADIYGVVDFYTMFYKEPVGERVIRICADPACYLANADQVIQRVCERVGIEPGQMTNDEGYTIERMTCLGLCDQAPGLLIDDHAFGQVRVDDVDALLNATVSPSELRVMGHERVVTRHIGEIDPLDLDTHREAGAFAALEKALMDLSPEAVIDQVKQSNLVGRGGAAFPTGLKWEFTRGATGTPKYVVCNADESEPGTFKDRVLMEGDPFRLIEGITLCGYAIGSSKGYLFVRGEYPQAQAALEDAIQKCHDQGLLGQNIFGTDFSFEIEVRRGAGAYICGEETALFEAIEGKRGFPRVKPPFPTTHGLFSKPTTINNVETLCAIPDIVMNGGEWFTQWGTEKSTGMKLFCVSGHVAQPGVVEAPFGTTVREIVEDYCGGFVGEPQAILMGGAAGGFLTPDQIDTPLTFEDLQPLGAPVGSGVIMVFNETVDLRQILKSLAHFFAHESCGKCYPCQLGTQRQMEILDRVAVGQGHNGDMDTLLDVGWTMTDASICGLGQTAAAAVLSALKIWPELMETS